MQVYKVLASIGLAFGLREGSGLIRCRLSNV